MAHLVSLPQIHSRASYPRWVGKRRGSSLPGSLIDVRRVSFGAALARTLRCLSSNLHSLIDTAASPRVLIMGVLFSS